jgi:hypothetical protein
MNEYTKCPVFLLLERAVNSFIPIFGRRRIVYDYIKKRKGIKSPTHPDL